ncbi:MAG: CHAP domain-containing protein [Myxococcaceae bacterium]
MRPRLLLLLLSLAWWGCATAPVRGAPTPPAPPSVEHAPAADARQQTVALARRLLGRRTVSWPGQGFPDDCSGLVEGIYASVGMPLQGAAQKGDNGVTGLYRYAQARGRIFVSGAPGPGDLVFFRDTYDQNRDGALDDGLTHVALVESVSEDGTVLIIHRVRRGVMRYRMNLSHPETHTDARTGSVLNDYLRGSTGASRPILTAQLFVAFASLLPADVPQAAHPALPVLAPQPAGGSI